METKKSLVIQAKYLEEFVKDDKTWYVHGVAFKNKDTGLFYTNTKEQEYFVEGHEVEYSIEKNEKEPKKSKIKVAVVKSATVQKESPEKAKNGLKYDDIDKYVMFKKADAISFSASYAKDLIVAGDKRKFDEIASEILMWQLEKLQMIK